MYVTIATGDRHATDAVWRGVLTQALGSLPPWEDRILIHGDQGYTDPSGTAHGIDTLASWIAADQGYTVIPMPANWDAYGRRAGPMRNVAMLTVLNQLRLCGYKPFVIAFHDSLDGSKGTRNMVGIARRAGVPVTVYRSDGTFDVHPAPGREGVT